MKNNKIIGIITLAIGFLIINCDKVSAFTIEKNWEMQQDGNNYELKKYNNEYYSYGEVSFGDSYCEYVNGTETCYDSDEASGQIFIEVLDENKNVKFKKMLNDFVMIQNMKRYNKDLYVVVGQLNDDEYSAAIAFINNNGETIKKTIIDDSEIEFYSAYFDNLEILSNGNIVVTGEAMQTNDTKNPSTLIIQIYDNNLNYIKTIDFEYVDLAYISNVSNIVVDNNDNFYFVKETRYRTIKNGKLYYKYNLMKYNKNGNAIYSKLIYDNGTEFASSYELSITKENELLLVGDNNIEGKSSAVFNKYDSDGNLIFNNIYNDKDFTYFENIIENENDYVLTLNKVNSETYENSYELIRFDKNGNEILRNDIMIKDLIDYNYNIRKIIKTDNNKYMMLVSYSDDNWNEYGYYYELSLYNDLDIEKTIGGNLALDKNKAGYGDMVKITANPDDEHILDYYLVDGEKTTDNTFIVKKDMKISAIFKEKYTYTLKNQSENILTDKDIIITIDGNYNKFEDLYINNIKVDKKYYTVREGSTIITISKDYLNTLDAGIKNIKLKYSNGKIVDTTIEIKGSNNIENIKSTVVENPKTFDAGITKYIIFLIISIIGGYSCLIRIKKKN